ncbi:MAG: ribbon-helix-helix domain-containing protein [Nitrosotalea sp.]
MGRIDIVLSDETELELRQEIVKELGMKKGNISIAIEEAIKLWIASKREKRSKTAKKAWETRKKDR